MQICVNITSRWDYLLSRQKPNEERNFLFVLQLLKPFRAPPARNKVQWFHKTCRRRICESLSYFYRSRHTLHFNSLSKWVQSDAGGERAGTGRLVREVQDQRFDPHEHGSPVLQRDNEKLLAHSSWVTLGNKIKHTHSKKRHRYIYRERRCVWGVFWNRNQKAVFSPGSLDLCVLCALSFNDVVLWTQWWAGRTGTSRETEEANTKVPRSHTLLPLLLSRSVLLGNYCVHSKTYAQDEKWYIIQVHTSTH